MDHNVTPEIQPLLGDDINNVKPRVHRWARVKSSISSGSIFLPNNTQIRLSDVSNYLTGDEISLWQCLQIYVALNATGVVAYSFVFEKWTILDSLYFTTALLTTVGYGDITPSTSSGKLFAVGFAMIGIVTLGLALGVIGSGIVEAEINLQDQIQEKSSETVERVFRVDDEASSPLVRGLVSSMSHDSGESLSSLLSEVEGQHGHSGARKLPVATDLLRYWPAATAILLGGVCIALLESWGGVDALYFTVVTATTIGFGDYSASLSMTKLCCLIFIPLSVATTGYILGQVAQFIIDCRREEKLMKLWSTDLSVEDLDALDEDESGGVSKLEYIKFMLQAMNKCEPALFDNLQAQFDRIDVLGDGRITKKDLLLPLAHLGNSALWFATRREV
mmetsp:Transcript_26260/g.59208  ORF Transcript_26260/g.59208 Transcript_26260/m.59208 type:complete len:391 (-) Transcript_26260:169-1341(-)